MKKITVTITPTETLGYSVKIRGHGEIDFLASDPESLGNLIAKNIKRIFEQMETR